MVAMRGFLDAARGRFYDATSNTNTIENLQ